MTTAADRMSAHFERRAVRAEGKLAAILAVHLRRRKRCAQCGAKWPCLTVRIIEAVGS